MSFPKIFGDVILDIKLLIVLDVMTYKILIQKIVFKINIE